MKNKLISIFYFFLYQGTVFAKKLSAWSDSGVVVSAIDDVNLHTNLVDHDTKIPSKFLQNWNKKSPQITLKFVLPCLLAVIGSAVGVWYSFYAEGDLERYVRTACIQRVLNQAFKNLYEERREELLDDVEDAYRPLFAATCPTIKDPKTNTAAEMFLYYPNFPKELEGNIPVITQIVGRLVEDKKIVALVKDIMKADMKFYRAIFKREGIQKLRMEWPPLASLMGDTDRTLGEFCHKLYPAAEEKANELAYYIVEKMMEMIKPESQEIRRKMTEMNSPRAVFGQVVFTMTCFFSSDVHPGNLERMKSPGLLAANVMTMPIEFQ